MIVDLRTGASLIHDISVLIAPLNGIQIPRNAQSANACWCKMLVIVWFCMLKAHRLSSHPHTQTLSYCLCEQPGAYSLCKCVVSLERHELSVGNGL